MAGSYFENFISVHFPNARKTGAAKYQTLCPSHPDRNPSLTISEGSDGRILLCCQAGCDIDEIVKALCIEKKDLFPKKQITGPKAKYKPNGIEEGYEPTAYYAYKNASGKLVYQVVRWEHSDPHKDKIFKQQIPDSEGKYWINKGPGNRDRVLYRLPELLKAIKEGQGVYLCEGEKDVDNLSKLGLVATCNAMGAIDGINNKKWEPQYTQALAGAHVVLLRDNDQTGLIHQVSVARLIYDVVASIRLLELPGLPRKGDVSDWIQAGGTKEQLKELASKTPALPKSPKPDDLLKTALAQHESSGDTDKEWHQLVIKLRVCGFLKDEALRIIGLFQKQAGGLGSYEEESGFINLLYDGKAKMDKKVCPTTFQASCDDVAPGIPSMRDAFGGFLRTPLGNAERFVKQHGPDVRFCKPEQTWYVFNGKVWERDRTGEVGRRAIQTVRSIYKEASEGEHSEFRKSLADWAKQSESKNQINQMIGLAEDILPIMPEGFDFDHWLFNCANGTIELRSGKLREHRREDYMTQLSPVVYDPEARLDAWVNFLEYITGESIEESYNHDSLTGFLRRAVGYSLSGDASLEILFFLHGPSSSGKSTFLEAVKSTIGSYADTIDFEVLLYDRNTHGNAPKPEIAKLPGKRLVTSVEVSEGKFLAEGLVKNLTGGDEVSVRTMYGKPFTFLPQFKLWLAANHAPRLTQDDDAIWRRILRIPFIKTVPKEKRDPELKRMLRNTKIAGPAILAWAVQGCLEWQDHGLGVPLMVEEATSTLRQDMNPMAEFFDTCCIFEPDTWTESASLRKEYEAWCLENGSKPESGRRFTDRLRQSGCEPEARKVGNSKPRGWRGIKLINCDGSELELPGVNNNSEKESRGTEGTPGYGTSPKLPHAKEFTEKFGKMTPPYCTLHVQKTLNGVHQTGDSEQDYGILNQQDLSTNNEPSCSEVYPNKVNKDSDDQSDNEDYSPPVTSPNVTSERESSETNLKVDTQHKTYLLDWGKSHKYPKFSYDNNLGCIPEGETAWIEFINNNTPDGYEQRRLAILTLLNRT